MKKPNQNAKRISVLDVPAEYLPEVLQQIMLLLGLSLYREDSYGCTSYEVVRDSKD